MKSRDVASLVFKITGWLVLIFVLTPALMQVLFIITGTLPISEISFIIALYVSTNIIIPLGIGLTLILANDKIAKLVYKNNDEIEVPCTAHEIRAIAFACIGIWIICSTLAGFINNILSSYYVFAQPNRIHWGWKSIGSFIWFIIGSVLFLQRRGLATLWEKLNKGRNPVHKD